MHSTIQHAPLDLSQINDNFMQVSRGAGAIVTFIGCVRDYNLDGGIDGLELEHYPGMTEKAMDVLAMQTRQKFACEHVCIVHRVGKIENHEPIVWVGASSRHRKTAFDAAMFAMDVLKRDIPLWKKEWKAGAATWVEAKTSDAEAAKRWFDNGQNPR